MLSTDLKVPSSNLPSSNLFIGLMSGTSMDAVDTALVEFSDKGLNLIAYEQYPIDQNLKTQIRQLSPDSTLKEITEYDAVLGKLFADSVKRILASSGIDKNEICAIGSHGQTVLHLPESPHPRTMQIGDANLISYETGIATIADFRRMDMAAGGQGAPLAPAFHEFAFRKQGTERVILNLGGIANITILPSDTTKPISGMDTGPGNGLLDDLNQRHNQTEMDFNSEWAATGQVNPDLLEAFLSDPYFELEPPKSTGRDHFNLSWVTQIIESLNLSLSAADVQATLLELTVENICTAIREYAENTQEIYACGGGAHNKLLMQKITARLEDIKVSTTEELSLSPDAVEAVTFAWLAKQTLEGRAGNNPAVTGANSPQILGGIYQPLKQT